MDLDIEGLGNVKFMDCEIMKLTLKPDDIIILSYPVALSGEASEHIQAIMQGVLDRCRLDNEIIILEEGLKLGILCPMDKGG